MNDALQILLAFVIVLAVILLVTLGISIVRCCYKLRHELKRPVLPDVVNVFATAAQS
jgi:hypothetical protein